MSTSLWKQRNFMLLWSGQLVSWLGTEISGIAMPLIVLALTGSPAQAGIVAAIRGLAYVFWSIPAGALVDRWDRKLVMVVSNLGSGLAMMGIAIALALHKLTVVELYVVCAVEGSFFVFANLALYASFTRVVSKEQFPAATAQSNTASHLALLTGPPLGGFLYQTVGGFITFFVDALSYIFNAVSILFISVPLQVEIPVERKAIRHEVKEAISWYRRQPTLRFLNLITAGQNAVFAGLNLMVIVLAKSFHAPALSIGLIFASAAVGGIVGSLVAARIHSHFRVKQLLVTISLLSFMIFCSYTFATDVLMLAAISALFCAVDPLQNVITASYAATIIPDGLRGRVISLTRLQVLAAYSFGFFISGVTLEYLNSNWTIGLFSGLLFVMFLAITTSKRLKLL